MNSTKRRPLAAIAIAALMAGTTVTAYAQTENAQERRDARDTKQTGRQDARAEKVDCRKADNKSNAACRQDKRENKQDTREESRDVRNPDGN
jgi:hypothetical protein